MSIPFPFQTGKFRTRARRRHRSVAAAAAEVLQSRQLLSATADLSQLNDEFTDVSTMANWSRIEQTEGWNSNQLQAWDVNAIRTGKMTLRPETSTWYQDWRGPMVYKQVTGDFVFTTLVDITDRDDVGSSDSDTVPGDAQFSLAGLMVRTPRNITNPSVDWQPGSRQNDGTNTGENYVFLSLGHATGGGFSFEAKTTRNSDSQLFLTPTDTNSARLRIARVGTAIISLYQLPGGDWRVMQRVERPDMPATLQLGIVAYSNWEKAGDFDPFFHNNTTLRAGVADPTPAEPFNPDLDASFEYARFVRPVVPTALAGVDLVRAATDQQLLSFLGETAGESGGTVPDPVLRVGVNLEAITDWSPAWIFRDAFQRARPWGGKAYNPATGNTQWQSLVGAGPELSVDENGWVTELKTWTAADGVVYEQRATTVIFTAGANQPAARYRAEWAGEGELAMWYVTERGTTADGRHYALVDMPAGAHFTIDLLRTDPANPIRDIHLWMPDYEGQSLAGTPWSPGSSGSPFHPEFIERLQPFDTLRFMDWMSTNDSDIVTWSDRRTLSQASQADGEYQYYHTNGVALEYQIELANELDANPWFNMPHQANDDYVRQFATLVRDTLEPGRTVYVEWSNEVWNSMFEVNHWLNNQLQLPQNAGEDFFSLAAREMRRDFDIWSEVFTAQPERLVRIVAGQQANPWILDQLLSHVNGGFDAASVSAYAGIPFETAAQFGASTTADQLIDFLDEESIHWALDRLADHRRLVDRYEDRLGRHLPLLTYESGSHVVGNPNPFSWSDARPAALEALHHPRMYEIYRHLLEGARAVGVELYNEFNFTGSAEVNFFGNYGLMHRQDQPLAELPQLRALYDFISEQSPDLVPPVIASIQSVTPAVREAPVAAVRLTFSEAINPASFDATHVRLSRSGIDVALPATAELAGPIEGFTYELRGLAAASLVNGDYTLRLDGAAVRDLAGNLGTGTVATQWSIRRVAPTITAVSSVSPNPRNSAVESIDVTFSEPIDSQSFDWRDVVLTLGTSANRMTAAQSVTALAGNTWRIGNLSAVTTGTGGFQLTVSAEGLTDIAGVPGTGVRRVNWTADMTPPGVSSFSTANPRIRNSPLGEVSVTFSEPLMPGTFSLADVTLTRDGAAMGWTAAQSIVAETTSRFQIRGLGDLQAADGVYELRVDAAGVSDRLGNTGTGGLSTTWQLDRVAPSGVVAPLPAVATSLSVPLVIEGIDPRSANGAIGSGVASHDLFVSVNDGPFAFWRTVTVSPGATSTRTSYTGQSNQTYAFRAVARDLAGNVEIQDPAAVEARITTPDLSAPVSSVTSVDTSRPVWSVMVEGSDIGLNGLASFELWVSVDGFAARRFDIVTVPDANAFGTARIAIPYRPIADGVAHTYRMYSIGRDRGGRTESIPAAPNDVQFSAVQAPLRVTNFQVGGGEAQRSLVTSVTVTFDSQGVLPLLLSMMNDTTTANDPFRLTRFQLDGTSPATVSLAGRGNQNGSTVTFDFGPRGLTNDGYYELAFDADGNGSLETVRRFYRLAGDLNGDRSVGAADDAVLTGHLAGTHPAGDLNGDGQINERDRTTLRTMFGRQLAPGLIIDA